MIVATLVLALYPPSLEAAFARFERESGGKLGVAVELLETGERHAYRGSERFPTQSVFKVPISLAVLAKGIPPERQIRIRKRDLVPLLHSPIRDRFPNGTEMTVAELIRAAIEESDGTASDVLVALAGGPSAVTGYLRALGVKRFTVATNERQQLGGSYVQYRNWATPLGCLDLLGALHRGKGMSPSARGRVLKHMVATRTFPGRIRGLLPAGTVVAHKTGSSGTSHGLTRATNDIGIGIVTLPDGRHMAVAVLLRDSRADDRSRDRAIALATKAAWDWYLASSRSR